MKVASDSQRGYGWLAASVVFVAVLVPQLLLVRAAGTDIPFQDQWNVEGAWLYPAWREGSLRLADLLRPVNEHRIVWTHLLNLALFSLDGQWDPLVQLVANAVLRATCAAGLAWVLSRELATPGRITMAAGGVFAFLPHLAWHSVLWGFETQVYFALGFSLLTLALLGAHERSRAQTVVGLASGVAGLLAMGPAALVPVALASLAFVRAAERRAMNAAFAREVWPAIVLLGVAWLGRGPAPEHAELHAAGIGDFLRAAGRTLGWPHTGSPVAALALNVPLLGFVVSRIRGWRRARPTDDFVLLVGGWSATVGLATAWARGGSAELAVGVPSRYVDFLVLLPLANAWCALALVSDLMGSRWRRLAQWVFPAWGGFLLVGWTGLSAETMRRIILPRVRDREAPVRLIQAYQMTGDTAVFDGQPRLLVPHPNLEIVHAVLRDPRMRGALPPSLQPSESAGPLSRGVRPLLGRQ